MHAYRHAFCIRAQTHARANMHTLNACMHTQIHALRTLHATRITRLHAYAITSITIYNTKLRAIHTRTYIHEIDTHATQRKSKRTYTQVHTLATPAGFNSRCILIGGHSRNRAHIRAMHQHGRQARQKTGGARSTRPSTQQAAGQGP